MTGTALLCSGQGRQNPGMFDLIADAPEAAAVFALATSSLDGRDPRKLVKDGSDADLHTNRVGQILCCTQAMAAWAAIAETVPRPIVVAGYSVGELAAWGIAGLLEAETVLRLAAQRAAAMDAATDTPSGLAAISGLVRRDVDTICDRHGSHVAIVNARDRFVVGGPREALAALIDDATAHGAERASLLDVAVASHTPLLREASRAFGDILKGTSMGAMAPEMRLLSGIDGAPVFDIEHGRQKLALQIGQPIDWQACMEACRAQDVTTILELGPGDALARMMHETAPEAPAHALSGFRSLDGLKNWLRARRR